MAEAVRNWSDAVGAKTAYIKQCSPWENGYCESFNARFRDEQLNGEIFYSLKEAQIIKTAQRIGLQNASPRNHRSDGSKAGHALTFKLDH